MNGIIATCEERNLKRFENGRAVLGSFCWAVSHSAVIGNGSVGATGEVSKEATGYTAHG
jgi:hypothetical protein